MKGLTEGRIVHYCFEHQGEVKNRPAMVVKVWNQDTGCSNLMVFFDGTNDGINSALVPVWHTSILYSEEPKPGTWHWIPQA